MQITLKQEHVESAIKAYVAKAGIASPVEDIDFTAGRGKGGLTATLEVQDPFALPGTAPEMAEGEADSPDPEEPVKKDTASPKSSATTKAEPKQAEDTPADNAETDTESPESTDEAGGVEPESEDAPPFEKDAAAANEDKDNGAGGKKASLFS